MISQTKPEPLILSPDNNLELALKLFTTKNQQMDAQSEKYLKRIKENLSLLINNGTS